MADTWDDSEDEWDVEDDDELDARLGLKALSTNNVPVFDDDEDLTIKQKSAAKKEQHSELKKKGNALAARKRAEQERLEEEELTRKAMELEAKLEANLSPEEWRALKQKQVEEADHELTDDLFGGVDAGPKGPAVAAAAGDAVKLADLKDHLKHARQVSQCIKVSTRCNVSFQVDIETDADPCWKSRTTVRFTWQLPSSRNFLKSAKTYWMTMLSQISSRHAMSSRTKRWPQPSERSRDKRRKQRKTRQPRPRPKSCRKNYMETMTMSTNMRNMERNMRTTSSEKSCGNIVVKPLS